MLCLATGPEFCHPTKNSWCFGEFVFSFTFYLVPRLYLLSLAFEICPLRRCESAARWRQLQKWTRHVFRDAGRMTCPRKTSISTEDLHLSEDCLPGGPREALDFQRCFKVSLVRQRWVLPVHSALWTLFTWFVCSVFFLCFCCSSWGSNLGWNRQNWRQNQKYESGSKHLKTKPPQSWQMKMPQKAAAASLIVLQ